MLSKKLVDELNEQLKYEFYSSHYYIALAAYFRKEDLDGIAHFFLEQAKEERFHAMKYFDFIDKIGEEIQIRTFEQPKGKFESIEEAFKAVVDHEEYMTERIYKMIKCAQNEHEYATASFLKWFVDEQVEEEHKAKNLLKKVQRIVEDSQGLLMLDNELSKRRFTPPKGTKI
ncbi:ferritin [Selenihalanaerobacter shriftii]|uniref:Ferritin n=1 Tax=Selenihalanaerobacter shriftii TaxID=142842 RepID=A0A1T4JQX0_9FIRM|nr:ferritin [Selenihalanaerobacter shriftii]SJZ32541.1 ferritin [Selenihalanaerobacter shriftii]